MQAAVGQTYSFSIQSNAVWLTSANAPEAGRMIDVVLNRTGDAKLLKCIQSSGNGNSIRLSLVADIGGKNATYHCVVHDPGRLLQTAKLRFNATHQALSTASKIVNVTHCEDGLFASTEAGDAFFVQTSTGRPEATMLRAGVGAARDSSGPLDDILAAKAGLATFLGNLADELPNIAAAVEKKVSKSVLSAFGAQISAVQADLDSLFDKPLTDFIAQNKTGKSATAFMAGMSDASKGAGAAQRPSRQAIHTLLAQKINIGRYLDVFSPAAMAATIAAATAPVRSVSSTGAAADPLDTLGKLFAPLANTLEAKTLVKLTGMAADDLIKTLSGTQPFSSVIDDFFSLFKVDNIMDLLNSILSGGQVSTLLGQITIKSYLDTPISNDFFQAFYQHFFPGQTFTARDLIAFGMAIVAFSVAEIQGKESEFHDAFAVPANLAAITGLPAKLVTIIGGTSKTPLMAMAAPRMRASRDLALGATLGASEADSDGSEAGGAVVAVILTLAVGIAGVFQYGTGLIASSVVGGVAGAIGQTIGGLVVKQTLEDASANMLAGFVGGFSGAFVATLLGNTAFGTWAQNGTTPTARINYLKMIMAGSAIALGGGAPVEFSRPFYKDDFADFVNLDTSVMNFLQTVRTRDRMPRIKLAVCFSALPFGCCSLGQKLATKLNAEVYAGRPPVLPWLVNDNPAVPGFGGWIKYTP